MTSERHNRTSVEDQPATSLSREIPAEILTATRDCLLAVGVRRTTLTDVARRAGVSRMTVYRLVPDVTALVLDVMTREFAELVQASEHRVSRRRTARARLVAGTVDVVARLPEQPLFRRILDVDPELLLPFLTDRWGSTQQLALGHLRRQLADGIADGSVRAGLDPDTTAAALLLTVTGFVVSARLLDPQVRPAVLAELQRGLDGWLRP